MVENMGDDATGRRLAHNLTELVETAIGTCGAETG